MEAVVPVAPPQERRVGVPPGGSSEYTLANRRGRVLLGGIIAAHFSHHVSNSILNPLLPYIRDALVLSYAQSGLLVSAFAISLGLSNAPLGMLADRVGSRPVIVWGLLLTAAVSAAVAFSAGYAQLLVALVVLGFIAGSYHAPAAALIARAFPARTRGAAMGLHITGGHMSFFLAPLGAAILVEATGAWQAPYLWFAILPVAAGAALWWIAPRAHERVAGVGVLAALGEVGNVVRLVGPLVSVSVLFGVVNLAMLAFLALYLVDARGMPAAFAAAIFGVPQIVGVLGSPLGGWLSDRIGRRRVIVLGLASFGPALWSLTVTPNEFVILPLVAIGLAGTTRATVTEVLVMDSAPAHRRATLMGGYYMLGQHVGGIAAPLFGVLAGVIGVGPAFEGVSGLLAILSLVVLGAARWL